MPTVTTHAPGTFCWFELHTTDDAKAQKFYSSLLGWGERQVPVGNDMVYRIEQLQEKDVAAITRMMPEMMQRGAPSNWMTYVSVENLDASAAKAKSLGATIAMEPMDVMDQGRMAVLADPQGAMISLWQGKATPGVGILGEVGANVWNELLTNDTAGAAKFYGGLFGWKAEAMPKSDKGYEIFKLGETSAGGMMKIRTDMGPMPPNWMVYFRVADADAAAKKASELGGRVLMPPQSIPMVGRFAVLMDPTGAAFSILTPEPGM